MTYVNLLTETKAFVHVKILVTSISICSVTAAVLDDVAWWNYGDN